MLALGLFHDGAQARKQPEITDNEGTYGYRALARDTGGGAPVLMVARMSKTQAVFVIGLPETGGCWLSNEKAWLDWDDASAELARIKARDPKATDRIFTIFAQAKIAG